MSEPSLRFLLPSEKLISWYARYSGIADATLAFPWEMEKVVRLWLSTAPPNAGGDVSVDRYDGGEHVEVRVSGEGPEFYALCGWLKLFENSN